ncbi:unnamed protein product [Paramecium sonneborni]|uniref:Uncharacterized protein n=1 Tax=Paramecium sonneborni TaxID=65129 RepID=A0A8S1RKD5_9CILI|nr:unnamed protein product [Paramecium sonneborni]
MAFMGIIVFLTLDFTIMNIIAGEVLEVGLGRYTSRHIKKTFACQKELLEFDIYSIKFKFFLKLDRRKPIDIYNLKFVRFIQNVVLFQ